MRQVFLRAILLMGLLVASQAVGSPAALASGQTVHLRIGDVAARRAQDAGLRHLLRISAPLFFKNGVSFPDAMTLIKGERDGFDSHSSEFLSAYVAYIREVCGVDRDHLLNDDTCQKLTAHFFGVLGHVIDDYRFDRYFVTRVSRECPHLPVDHPDKFTAQDLTDGPMDTAVSLKRFDVRPDAPAVPLTPFLRPFHPRNVLIPLRRVFSEVTFTKPGVRAGVAAFWSFIYVVQPASVLIGRHNVINVRNCPWPIQDDPKVADQWQNYEIAFGGVEDSGRKLADFIDKSWEILTTDPPGHSGSNSIPRYERSSCWHFPNETTSVRDSVGDGWRFDFASWIAAGKGVSRFQVHSTSASSPAREDRVATLVDGELLVQRWPFDVHVEPVSIADNVLDFQLEGDRIAVLLTNDLPRSIVRKGGPIGGDLFVMEGPLGSDLVPVARNVLDFRLEDDKIGILVPAGSGFLTGKGKPAAQQAFSSAIAPVRKLLVKDGALDSPWRRVITDKIQDFQLEGERIAVLREKRGKGIRGERGALTAIRSDELLVKESISDRKWVSTIVGDIEDFQLERNKIGVLLDGDLLIKNGPLDSDWIEEASGVSQFEISGGRIGVLADGEFSVNRVPIDSEISHFDLNAGNFGAKAYALNNKGMPRYAAGNGTTFGICFEGLPVRGGISQFQIGGAQVIFKVNDTEIVSPNMIGVLVDGTLYVKTAI